jgi:hypothetical protein
VLAAVGRASDRVGDWASAFASIRGERPVQVRDSDPRTAITAFPSSIDLRLRVLWSNVCGYQRLSRIVEGT